MHVPPEAIRLSTLGLPHKRVLTFSYEVPRLSLKQQPSWLLFFKPHIPLHLCAQQVDEHLRLQQVPVCAVKSSLSLEIYIKMKTFRASIIENIPGICTS